MTVPAALPGLLVASGAAIVGVLGTLHLVFTYVGTRFHPRDDALMARMKLVAPRISRQTTMWRAGTGFHASHSLGAMLFGIVYVNLGLTAAPVLFGSPVLLLVGAGYLAALVGLAWRYWFRVPLVGASLALLLFVSGWVTAA